MSELLIYGQGLSKSYPMGLKRLEVLKKVDIQIQKGEAVCIVGSSGAGKSTLLHILGTLDRPSLGRLLFKGRELTKMNDDDLAEFRNTSMGFVFQFHHLLAEFTALENVTMPGLIAGKSKKYCEDRAHELLKLLGLDARSHHFPSELSGGEQQRVSVARALFSNPEVLFADEPTGNLDTANGLLIRDLFFELKEKLGLTLVVVTHDRDFAQAFPRILSMKDGEWAF